MSYERELDVAKQLARAAGAALLEYRLGGVDVQRKATGEVVTAGDVAADRLIRAGLADAFPNDALYTEETTDTSDRLASRRVWIVDPLDSTSTYVAGGDEFSVSIGLAVDGQPVLGAVHNPARDELVAGGSGLGVTLNGDLVGVSTARQLYSARLTTSRKEWEGGLRDVADGLTVTPIASMAYKLARVAAGLDDGVFSTKTRKEWGTCAGVALVLAGGGGATLLDGSSIPFNRSPGASGHGLVAGSETLQPDLRDWLITQLHEGRAA